MISGMTLVIASNNAHKIREFKEILPSYSVITPQDLGIDFNHDETETSFALNAVGKATTLWRQLEKLRTSSSDYMVLADDSGLVVPALGGEPGIYSARYGTNLQTDHDRNTLLLKNLMGKTDRKAYYVCSMALVHGIEKYDIIQETWDGTIAFAESQGIGGFGYDPIFFLPEYGCTVAELAPGIKSTISHRAKAILRLLKLL